VSGQASRREPVTISDSQAEREHARVVNGRLWVDVIAGGGGGGTQYPEGTVEAAATGTVILWEDVGDTFRTVAAATPLPVTIISGGGGGTQYAEDTAHVSGDLATMAGVVQQAADAALSTDGDRSLLQVDSSGFLKVNVKAGAAAGTEYTDGDADATPTGSVALGFDGANVRAVTTDAAGDLQVDILSSALPTGAATAALQLPNSHDVTVDNAAGAAAVNVQDGGNSITVDGTVAATQSGTWTVDIGTGGGGTQYAEDTAHVSGDTLTLAGVVQRTSDGALSTDGDRSLLQVDGSGFLKVNVKTGGSGTEYTEDDPVNPVIGTAIMWRRSDTTMTPVDELDAPLPVDIKSFPGGVEPYLPEDTPHLSGDILVLAGVVQQSADAALSQEGDRSLMQVDGTGWLKTTVKASALPAGAATAANQTTEISHLQTLTDALLIDDFSTHATGVSRGPLLMAAATPTDAAVTANDIGAVAMTLDRKLHVSVQDALPAGGNSIGVVDTELPAAAALGDADANPTAPKVGAALQGWNGSSWYRAGGSAANGLEVDITRLPNEGQQTMANSISVAIASNQSVIPVMGELAHDDADSGNPVKLGMKAIANGASPTAVAANDRTNWYASRHGIPWVMGGHPNTITREITILAADGAQTNASLLGAIAAGTSVVVTMIDVMASGANTVDVKVRIGFGTASVPAASLTGVNGLVLSHPKIKAGSGVVKGSGAGVIAQGASDEELRITCDSPTSGAITVTVTYHTIEI